MVDVSVFDSLRTLKQKTDTPDHSTHGDADLDELTEGQQVRKQVKVAWFLDLHCSAR